MTAAYMDRCSAERAIWRATVTDRQEAHHANLAQALSEFPAAGAAPTRARKSAPVSHCTSQSPTSARRSASVIGANSSARRSAVGSPKREGVRVSAQRKPGAHRTDFVSGSEQAEQQAHGVQVAQPLAVGHIDA